METPTGTSEPRQGFPLQREVLVRQELLPQSGTHVLLTWAVLSQSSVCALCRFREFGKRPSVSKGGAGNGKGQSKATIFSSGFGYTSWDPQLQLQV